MTDHGAVHGRDPGIREVARVRAKTIYPGPN
jgi:hypothetical protein